MRADMAKTIRQWADFPDPQIDPIGFPEEIPAHFAQVEKFLAEDAAHYERQRPAIVRNTSFFHDYVEYLNMAGLDESVLSSVADAAEAADRAEAAHRQLAEALADASVCIGEARRAAEAKYGDWEMPRFDQANAG
jgi:hypothetical protein